MSADNPFDHLIPRPGAAQNAPDAASQPVETVVDAAKPDVSYLPIPGTVVHGELFPPKPPAPPVSPSAQSQTPGGWTDPQQYAEVVKGVIPGIVQSAGTAVQAPDVYAAATQRGAAERVRERLALLDQADRGEPIDPRMDVAGYSQMTPEQRARAREGLSRVLDQQWVANPTPIQDRPFFQTGEAMQEYAKGILPAAPGYEEAYGRQVGQGLGSVAFGLPIAALTGPVGGLAVFSSMGVGEATQRAVDYDRKERAAGRPGLTQDQIISSGLLGIGPGSTDLLPIQVLLGRLPVPIPSALSGPISQAIGRIGIQALIEGVQEGGQGFLQDLIAREMYNSGQVLGENFWKEASVGAGVGGLTEIIRQIGSGMVRSAAGRRGSSQTGTQPTQPQAPEAAQEPAQRQEPVLPWYPSQEPVSPPAATPSASAPQAAPAAPAASVSMPQVDQASTPVPAPAAPVAADSAPPGGNPFADLVPANTNKPLDPQWLSQLADTLAASRQPDREPDTAARRREPEPQQEPALEPLAQPDMKPVAEPAPQRIVTPDGSMEIEAVPVIVELDDLRLAEGSLQPRDRSRAEYTQGARERASQLDPSRLQPDRTSDRGAPIILIDGTVISGNGRTMSIAEVYRNPDLADRAEAYRASLGPAAQGMRQPVLVMQAQSLAPQDAQRFADLSNRSAIAQMSATERAMRDAQALGPDAVQLYQGGDFTAPQNRRFLQDFMTRVVTAAEMPSVSRNGELTQEGAQRLRSAVLAAAYGDAGVLSRMLESTDDNVRAITAGLLDAAPKMAQLRSAIASGEVSADMDAVPALMAAINTISDLRSRRVPVQTWLAQTDAFGRDPVIEAWVKSFYYDDSNRAKRQEKIAQLLNDYAGEAILHRPGGLFADETTPADVLGVARRKNNDEQADDLFAPAGGVGQGVPEGRKSSEGRPDATGRQGIGQGQQANEILAAIQSSSSSLEYEAREMIRDAQSREQELRANGATPAQIASEFSRFYGAPVSAADVESGNVWWATLANERLIAGYADLTNVSPDVSPELYDAIFSANPLVEAEAAPIDVNARPLDPQRMRGVQGGPSAGPRMTPEMRQAAIALSQQGLSARQISNELRQQFGQYVRTNLVEDLISAERTAAKSAATKAVRKRIGDERRRAAQSTPEYRARRSEIFREVMSRPEMQAWLRQRAKALNEQMGRTVWTDAMVERLISPELRSLTLAQATSRLQSEFPDAAGLTPNAVQLKRAALGYSNQPTANAPRKNTSPFTPQMEKRLADPDMRQLIAADAVNALRAEFGDAATSRITPTTITNKRAGSPSLSYTGKTTNPTGFQWSPRDDGRSPDMRLAELMQERMSPKDRADAINREFGRPGMPPVTPKAVQRRWEKIKDSVLKAQGDEPMFAVGGWDPRSWLDWIKDTPNAGREDATTVGRTGDQGGREVPGQQPGATSPGGRSDAQPESGRADGVRQSFRVRDFVGRVVDAPPNSLGLRQSYLFLHPPKVTWPFVKSAATTLKNLDVGVPNWTAKAHVSEIEPGVWQVMSLSVRKKQAADGLTPEFLDAMQAELGDIRPPDQMRPETYQAWRAWEMQGSRWATTSVDPYVEHRGLYYSPDMIRTLRTAAQRLATSDPSVEARDRARREFNELSDLVERLPPEDDILAAIQGWHGSPHDFNAERLVQMPDGRTEYVVGQPDQLPPVPPGAVVLKDFPLGRFREDKVGTGEGAQAYGYGAAYIAEREGVARSYRDALGGQRFKDGSSFDDANPAHQASAYIAGTKSKDEALAALEQDIAMSRRQMDEKHAQILLRAKGILQRDEPIPELNSGRMYEVNIKASPDEFLDWDKPRDQLAPKVKSWAEQTFPEEWSKAADGASLYQLISQRLASKLPPNADDGWTSVVNTINDTVQRRDLATKSLRDAGIPGIKYLDQGSRSAGEGSRNYVVFDDSLIEIVAKDGKPVSKKDRDDILAAHQGSPANASAPIETVSPTYSPTPPTDITSYIDEGAYRKLIRDDYIDDAGGVKASSRNVPVSKQLPPVGSWRISGMRGLYGREIEHLIRVPLSDLQMPELDSDGRLDPVKRGDDERYAQWLKDGRRAPPIEIVQTEKGTMRVMDGHRRALAARRAGQPDIEAWVSYSVPTGKIDSNGNPIMTGLTFEMVRSGLDMSPEARKARAEQMGFDTSRVWYHGTTAGGFEQFAPDRANTSSKTGVPPGAFVFSSSPATASTYAVTKKGFWGDTIEYDSGASVLPVYAKRGRMLKVNAKGENWRDIAYKGQLYDINELAGLAQSRGYDGLEVKNVVDSKISQGAQPASTLFIFDPSNIRSVNAAFDPAQEASANLMAAVNAAPVRNPASAALAAIQNNRPFVVQRSVVDGVLDVLRPMLGIVPDGTSVATLSKVAPISKNHYRMEIVNGQIAIKDADGDVAWIGNDQNAARNEFSELKKSLNGADAILTFETTDGRSVKLPIDSTIYLGTRALNIPSLGTIGFLRFDLSGDLGRTLRGEVGHELVHVLRRGRHFRDADWSRLVAQAHALGALDSEYQTYLKQIGNPYYSTVASGVTGAELYAETYKKQPIPVLRESLDQEAVAHMIELYNADQLFDPKMWADPGVAQILDAILDGSIWRVPQGDDVGAPRQGELELMGAAGGRPVDASGHNEGLSYLIGPKSQVGVIGQEIGTVKDDGVSVLKVKSAPAGYESARLVYTDSGRIVGAMQVTKAPDGPYTVANTYVAPEFRRRGIATELNNRAERLYGTLARSDDPSPAGQAFRDSVDQAKQIALRRMNWRFPEGQTEAGKVVGSQTWYHGANRADRIAKSGKFDPKRATSGPMPFFSNEPEVSSKYAIGKPDTSRAMNDDGDISNYFTVSPKQLGIRGRAPISVERSWIFLTPAQRAEIMSRAKRVGYENFDSAAGPLILHPEGVDASLSGDHFDYLMKTSARGNPLKALREMWYDGGSLIGSEAEMMTIWSLAGYPHKISDEAAPWVEAPGVFPVHLRMVNPLDTHDSDAIKNKVIPALEAALKKDRTRITHGVDSWHKSARYTPKSWLETLKKDFENGDNSYVWTSIPDKITEQLQFLGYDGILDRGNKTGGSKDHMVAIPFAPQQIRSVNAAYDPSRFDSPDLMAAAQKGQTRLAALHNLSAENLAFADKMGGIAVPSIGVVKEGMGLGHGFGEITMIGRKNLGDPSQNPVYDADAWSIRFPRPDYKAVSTSKAQPLMDALRPYGIKFDDTGPAQETWDAMVNRPDPERAISPMLRSAATQAMFLDKVKGKIVEPVMRSATTSMRNKWVTQPAFQAFLKQYGYDGNYSHGDPYYVAMSQAAKEATDQQIAEEASRVDDPTDRADLIELWTSSRDTNLFDADSGLLNYGRATWIGDDIRKIGKKEVDRSKTRERLERAIKPFASEFKTWVENQIVPLYGAPRIKVNGRLEPYTLENITSVMTAPRSVTAQEDHMTFGEGKARAAAASRITSVDEARNRAEWQMADEKGVNEAREKAKALLQQWRDAVVPYNKYVRANSSSGSFGSTFEALDGSMRALAAWAKRRGGASGLRSALAREDFVGVPQDVLDLGVEAGRAFMEAPVPYFESKPQRAVKLNEFAGAVIPKKASAETRAILDKHGIPYREYDSSKDDAKDKAAAKFARDLAKQGEDTLFAVQRGRFRNQDQLGYYSRLDEVLASLNPKDKVTIDTLLQKGVKKAEIEARGLMELFGSRERRDNGAVNEASSVDAKTWDRLKPLDAALDDDAAHAIDAWVGVPHDAIEKGLAGGLMVPSILERMDNAKLDAMAAPVRKIIRDAVGNNLVVYRGERKGGSQSHGRQNKLASYTTDRRVAERFAGVVRSNPEPTISDNELAAFKRTINDTGEVKIGRYTYRKNGDYIDIYDPNDNFVTDAQSIDDVVRGINERAIEANNERDAALNGVREVVIPVDAVVWATDRAHQSEIIAYANRETPRQGDRTDSASARDTQLNQSISVPVSSLIETAGRNRVEVRESIRIQKIVDGDTVHGNGPRDVKWPEYSLDPSNPSYRETVLHLPEKQPELMQRRMELDAIARDRLLTPEEREELNTLPSLARRGERDPNFRQHHFSDVPNVIGHMMTSMVKHEGRPVYLIDQIQSDWGQKLRDGGVRDEAKIAELKRRADEAKDYFESVREPALAAMRSIDNLGFDTSGQAFGAVMQEADWSSRWDVTPEEAKPIEVYRDARLKRDLLQAELRTAEAATPGNPLVNTTDQWVNTTLRRAIRQAAEADAAYIAIPHGDTVLSYNPGDTEGMRGFYGSRTSEGIVPKNLRNLLQKLDKASPTPMRVESLETPTRGMVSAMTPPKTLGADGYGFTLFPLTDRVKREVLDDGQPLFAMGGFSPRKIEQVWGPKWDILMGQQYRIAEAGGDLSTMYDILNAKLSKASGIDPKMRAAMEQKVREIYDQMGPEWRALAGIEEPPQIPSIGRATGGKVTLPKTDLSMLDRALALIRNRRN